MKVKIQVSNLPAICGSTLFFDRRARRDGVPVLVAPTITNSLPIANGGTETTYDTILESAFHNKGVIIDPDVVEPDSRCKYVTKKLLWNRPVWSANAKVFGGTGQDNDGADTPVRGTSSTGPYIVPASFCHFSGLTGACADDVHPNADGAPVVGLMMPATLQLLQHPTPTSITIGLNGEKGNWRNPSTDEYENNDITIGLAAIVGQSLTFWDEPEGSVSMNDHVGPWIDSKGGRCITHIYLNQWEVGKGMRAKKKKRGIDEQIKAGAWDDLDRDAINWFNKVYDSKQGTYAAMKGVSFNPGQHSDVSPAKARSIIRYSTYNYTASIYARRLFGLFMLSNYADMFDGLLTNADGYDLTELVFRQSSDSLEADALKAMLQRDFGDADFGGVAYVLAPIGILHTCASGFKQVDGKWTEMAVSDAPDEQYAFLQWLRMGSIASGWNPGVVDSDIRSVLASFEKTEVASLYGRDRKGTWAENTKLQLTTYCTQTEHEECSLFDLIPLPLKSSINKQIVNSTGVVVSTGVTDADVSAVYGAGSRLLLGVGQGYRTNPIHAFFEDGIQRNTRSWTAATSGDLMWWWCGVDNGENT